MRKPRNLSPEERALWDKVAERTHPLRPDRPPSDATLPKAHAPPKKTTTPSDFDIGDFRIGQRANDKPQNDLLRPLADRLAAAPVNMDHKSFSKMKRGKLRPQATLDLHGLTLAEAHPDLIQFVLRAHSDGLRLVLVITGKGKDRDDGGPIPTRFGILRHQVPRWLATAPLSNVVLQVTPAHQRHGGHGAYYVYLRRHR